MYSPEEPKGRNISREDFYANKNWHEIKKRYFCGESPKQIAKDYPDITEKQITNRAFRYKWREAKAMINLAAEKGIEDTLMQIADRVEKITLKLLDDFLAGKAMPAAHISILNNIIRLTWPNVKLEPIIIREFEIVGVPFDLENI